MKKCTATQPCMQIPPYCALCMLRVHHIFCCCSYRACVTGTEAGCNQFSQTSTSRMIVRAAPDSVKKRVCDAFMLLFSAACLPLSLPVWPAPPHTLFNVDRKVHMVTIPTHCMHACSCRATQRHHHRRLWFACITYPRTRGGCTYLAHVKGTGWQPILTNSNSTTIVPSSGHTQSHDQKTSA